MIFRFLCFLILVASGHTLITFADLCFHSRQDYLLCQKNLASLTPNSKIGSGFFAGLDPATTSKLLNGPDDIHVPGKRAYDFIRFGRSPERSQSKKASSSYDYIRFGKRSLRR